MMPGISERALIDRLVAGMPRSTRQRNRPHESDAELIELPGGQGLLALTTDGVVEEIASGLYGDPYLAGWMVVTVNASDLAAVGAEPVGILVSEVLPPDLPSHDLARLQGGIRDAAKVHELPLLGGDTNVAAALQLTGTAVGIAPRHAPTRCGASPGDRLFASGPLGVGAAFAFDRLLTTGSSRPVPFRPVARLREGRLLPDHATAVMDTSDGAIATIDELSTLNGVGVCVDADWELALHPAALATARGAGLPPWTLLAGPHGEFELLFTVPPDRVADLRSAAAAIQWQPVALGVVTREPGLMVDTAGETLRLDTSWIRNLFTDVGGDPARYLEALLGGTGSTVETTA